MDKFNWVSKFKKATTVDKFSKIVSMCKDKKVLDVGCIGQDKAIDNPNWLHGRLKKSASSLLGVDINVSEFQRMNELGFMVVEPEELKSKSELFDVIVMGDVIEHVNDPGTFLSFYSKFLKSDGRMIICTPNTFGVRYFLQVLFYGLPGTNEEHTISFEPITILELFSRIEIEPVDFYWLKEYDKPKLLKRKIVYFIASLFVRLRKYYSSNFMFVVRRKSN